MPPPLVWLRYDHPNPYPCEHIVMVLRVTISRVWLWVWRVRVFGRVQKARPVPVLVEKPVRNPRVYPYPCRPLGTGTGSRWSYLSNTMPLLTVLLCYRYCTLPNTTPSPVAHRLLPTDP